MPVTGVHNRRGGDVCRTLSVLPSSAPLTLMIFLVLSSLMAAHAFLSVAHMVNTERSLKWAVDTKGANAVEMDLRFDPRPTASSDNPSKFLHSGVCDCVCYVNIAMGENHVCYPLSQDPASNSCYASNGAVAQLALIPPRKSIALVYIDSKIDQISDTIENDKDRQRANGANVWALLRDSLIHLGYTGKLLVGVPSIKYTSYLDGLLDSARAETSPSAKAFLAAKKLLVTIDQEKYDVAVPKLREYLNSGQPIAYSNGISSCVPGNYKSDITNAINAKIFNETIIWTLDDSDSMAAYIDAGATGIVSNMPLKVYNLARSRNLYATRSPEDTMPIRPPCSSLTCDCNYRSSGQLWGGGCYITQPALQGCACKCSYKGAWTCGGESVDCNSADPNCANPSTSLQSCLVASNDCSGYQGLRCDCSYVRKGVFKSSGCKITTVPPRSTACKCVYRGAWTCSGEVVRCRDNTSPYCTNPGYNLNTCQQGGGDCLGY